MEREDTQPWYRHFWPWFIIALLASSVAASLTTVWIAMQTTDSLVVQSEDGVRNAADRRISAERLAGELGLAARVEFDRETGVITAIMRSGDIGDVPTTLQLEFSHPAFADRDLDIAMTRARPDAEGNPVWVGHVTTMPEGRWYVVLKSGNDWRLTNEWRGEPGLTLRPAGAPDNGAG